MNCTTFFEYSAGRKQFAKYPNRGNTIIYPAVALAGEAGEVCNEIKKYLRDDHHVLTPARATRIIEEMGDVLWYLDALAEELGVTLEEIAEGNLDKLAKRYS